MEELFSGISAFVIPDLLLMVPFIGAFAAVIPLFLIVVAVLLVYAWNIS